MRLLPEKYSLPALIGMLLFAGFLTTGMASYLVARDTIRHEITEQTLPLTGDSIHAQIRADLQGPGLIASTMAEDSFVLDWLRGSQGDPDPLTRYLLQIRQKYRVSSSFVVSAASRLYYSSDAPPRLLNGKDPHDRWFDRTRDAGTPLVTGLDAAPGHGDRPAVFLSHRIVDDDGRFLGAAGVALSLDELAAHIDRYQEMCGCRIYLVDGDGKLMLSGSATRTAATTLASLPGLGPLAPRLLAERGEPARLVYRDRGEPVLVNSRYLPEPGWHLLVEHGLGPDERAARRLLGLNLAIGAGVLLLTLGATLLAVRRYQRRLEHIAGTDALTGLLNRQAFELLFNQAALDAERTGRPLSAILFDIDFFKQVNDTHGHPAGDGVLRTIARLVRGSLRESDTITRWGGEEFVVLLKECPLEQAAVVAEKLRHTIDRHDFAPAAPDCHITVSLGVAQFAHGESSAAFLARADEALYKAKANGRNRLQVARTPAPTLPERPERPEAA